MILVGNVSSQKLKTAHKLKAQTSKIVSSFKGPNTQCTMIREYVGHKDGVWEVSVARAEQPVIGTASADHRACIWSTDSGRCLLQYQGHSGSVNSIRFHPTKDLVLTASGDCTAHLWQAAVNWDIPVSIARKYSENRGSPIWPMLLGEKVVKKWMKDAV